MLQRRNNKDATKAKRTHLNRALSKLGILTRSEATSAILAGRVSVGGRIVRDPAAPIDLESARIEVDGQRPTRTTWRTILFHKPRGVVTTRRDPEGRPTVYDVIGAAARGLVPVGRLDMATSGLLLLTTDTSLGDQLTDPRHELLRVYVTSVRGRVTDQEIARLEEGILDGGDRLQAETVRIRKSSARETHLTVELCEGKNREVRRLFEAIGHEVTRLKRIRFGNLELGDLAPGQWRDIERAEIGTVLPRVAHEREALLRTVSTARIPVMKRRGV
jgi:23S rRNA pseudouridine2605 synthase